MTNNVFREFNEIWVLSISKPNINSTDLIDNISRMEVDSTRLYSDEKASMVTKDTVNSMKPPDDWGKQKC